MYSEDFSNFADDAVTDTSSMYSHAAPGVFDASGSGTQISICNPNQLFTNSISYGQPSTMSYSIYDEPTCSNLGINMLNNQPSTNSTSSSLFDLDTNHTTTPLSTSDYSTTACNNWVNDKEQDQWPIVAKGSTKSIISTDDDNVLDSEEVLNNEDHKLGEEAMKETIEVQNFLNVKVSNVVCSYSTRCHLSLRDIALRGFNVIFKKENNMVNWKLRKPRSTANIWSSGKITCTGACTESDAHVAARRIARCLQKLGFNIRICKYRVVNVLATCRFNFGINITDFSKSDRKHASYEPEIHPGVTFRMPKFKATLKIFSTGSVTVTANCVDHVHEAIYGVYTLVKPFSTTLAEAPQAPLVLHSRKRHTQYLDSDSDEDCDSD